MIRGILERSFNQNSRGIKKKKTTAKQRTIPSLGLINNTNLTDLARVIDHKLATYKVNQSPRFEQNNQEFRNWSKSNDNTISEFLITEDEEISLYTQYREILSKNILRNEETTPNESSFIEKFQNYIKRKYSTAESKAAHEYELKKAKDLDFIEDELNRLEKLA